MKKSLSVLVATLFGFNSLNGQPSYLINTPTSGNAILKDVFLLNDSKSVLYYGNQIDPAVVNAYLWMAP